jgi:hypothetical protein
MCSIIGHPNITWAAVATLSRYGLRRRPDQKDDTVRLQEFFDYFIEGHTEACMDGERDSVHREGAGERKA